MSAENFLDSAGISEHALLFKALGDETRVQMIGLLRHGELCVCDLMEVLGLPQSTASRHLAYLKNSRWVIGRRQGKWMHYRLRPEVLASALHRPLIDHLSGLGEVRQAQERLRVYLQEKDTDKVCSISTPGIMENRR